MRFKKFYHLSVLLIASIGCFCFGEIQIDTKSENKIVFGNEFYTVYFDLEEGFWSLYKKNSNNELIIKNAYSETSFKIGSERKLLKSFDRDLERKYAVSDYKNNLLEGKLVSITHQSKNSSIVFKQHFIILKNRISIITYNELENIGNKEIIFYYVSPVKINFDNGGGVFVGDNPDDVWILENGYDFKFNFWVRLISSNSSSISDWNSILFNNKTEEFLLGGFLNSESALMQVNTLYSRDRSLMTAGRKGITSYTANCKYMPSKMLLPKESLTTEKFYLTFGIKDALEELETFADLISIFSNVKKWKGEVPTGWNSWATEYHHDINEDKMLLNAEFVKNNLLDYGMTYFQIDDPWQIAKGDWEANSNFPSGMKTVLGKIKNMGLKPGLWLAPFIVNVNSSIYKEKKHWIVKKSFLGQTVMSNDEEILDLSHPEVKKWLYNLFYKIRNEWGCVWFKLDFIYYALLGDNYYDKTKTNVEIFRDALKIIRSAVGEDSFIMLVAVPIYTGLGIADGMRVGLDKTPFWNDDEEYTAQGLKPLYKSLVRRYYLNHRVWILHPDMFYLGVEKEEEKRWKSHLSLEEAKTYSSVVGLMGGITKIGNLFVNLSDEQLKILKSLLPPFKGSNARPIDLLEMRYPEIWNLKVTIPSIVQTQDDDVVNRSTNLEKGALREDLHYDVLGLVNWGFNARWGKEIQEAEREIEVDFTRLNLNKDDKYLAFEFWDEKFLGEFKNTIKLRIPPRTVKVIALHKNEGHPQFLSTNRHITQGATDLKWLKWNESDLILEGEMLVDKGFDYRIYFYIPNGFLIKSAEIVGLKHNYKLNDNILIINFMPSEKKEVLFRLKF